MGTRYSRGAPWLAFRKNWTVMILSGFTTLSNIRCMFSNYFWSYHSYIESCKYRPAYRFTDVTISRPSYLLTTVREIKRQLMRSPPFLVGISSFFARFESSLRLSCSRDCLKASIVLRFYWLRHRRYRNDVAYHNSLSSLALRFTKGCYPVGAVLTLMLY